MFLLTPSRHNPFETSSDLIKKFFGSGKHLDSSILNQDKMSNQDSYQLDEFEQTLKCEQKFLGHSIARIWKFHFHRTTMKIIFIYCNTLTIVYINNWFTPLETLWDLCDIKSSNTTKNSETKSQRLRATLGINELNLFMRAFAELHWPFGRTKVSRIGSFYLIEPLN